MTIKSWTNKFYGKKEYCLCTNCAGDQGLETAWKQITKVIEDGCKKEDIEKIVDKLTKNKDSIDTDHLIRVGLRAAERYCLGKLLTGETEERFNTSGRWDPLKEAITEEFLNHFSIDEVYHRITEYFISIASIHNEAKKDIRAVIAYGPGFFKYPSDMTKAEMLKTGMSPVNRYWDPKYLKALELRRRDFESEARKVELKYKSTEKDDDRVTHLISDKISQSQRCARISKIQSAEKATIRWAIGLKYGFDLRALRDRAQDLGVSKVELEAYALNYTGKSFFDDYINPKEKDEFYKQRIANFKMLW